MKKINNEQGIAHLALIIAALGVLVVGGVGYRVYSNNSSKPIVASVDEGEAPDEKVLPQELSDLLTEDKLLELVDNEKPGAVITEVALETEDGGLLVYKVIINNGEVIAFNARTGAKLPDQASDQAREATDQLPSGYKPGITFAKAIETARAELPGKTIKKVELEVEDGKVVYSVRFTAGERVDVDAATGGVVRKETKNDNKETDASSDDVKKSSNKNRSSNSGSGSSNSGRGSISGDDSDDSSVSDSDDGTDDEDSDDDADGDSSGSGSSGSGSDDRN